LGIGQHVSWFTSINVSEELVLCSLDYYKTSEGGAIEFLLNVWYVCTNLNDLVLQKRGMFISTLMRTSDLSLSNGEIWKLSVIFPNYCHLDTRYNGGQHILYEFPEERLMSAHPKWTFISEMLSSQIDRRDVTKPAIHLSWRSCRRQVTCHMSAANCYSIRPFKTKVDTLCNPISVVNLFYESEIVGIN